MKILILTQYFPPEVGAPQNRLHELAVRLQQKGADVSILTAMPNYPQMEIHKNYKGKFRHYENMNELKVYRSWIFVSKSKSVFFRLLNYFSFVWSSFWSGWLRLTWFDYVFCESPPLFLGISAYLLAKLKGAKLIFNVSDLWPESAEKLNIVKNKIFLGMAYRLEKFLYKKSYLITGQTQGIVKSISTRFPSLKTFWLPNGVDISLYSSFKDNSGWRYKNNFLQSDFILLYGGILGHAQGLEVILNAANILKSNKGIKFILLGSGPEKEKLEKLKSTLSIENIFFINTVPKKEMPLIINAANATIIPLKKLELFKGAIPSKIFESLSMEKPILLGVEGEAKELFIEEGNCGIAFEPENADDLAKKIIHLYNDRDLLKQLGENGRKYVSEKFNRNLIAENFWNYFLKQQ